MRLCTRLVLVAFVYSIVQPALGQQAKKKVESADQRPVHSYPVSGKASDLLSDDAAFAKLTSALQKDLISDLQNYDIEDKSTLKKYYNSLMQIAYLTGRYDEALSYMQKRNALQDKPAAKAMAGLICELGYCEIDRPVIDGAKEATEQAQRAFEAEFAERVRKLPYETVQNEVKQQKAWFELLSPNFLTGMVEQQYDALAQKTGTIPKKQPWTSSTRASRSGTFCLTKTSWRNNWRRSSPPTTSRKRTSGGSVQLRFRKAIVSRRP